jgi:peptidoglycan/xylan/chitin deacetylase (PgdA/CDA1 family)
MRVVSPLLKYGVYSILHHTGWLRRRCETGSCRIINYHGVIPSDYSVRERALDGNLVSAETFRHHLKFLKENYSVITPSQFRDWLDTEGDLPPNAVLITCDDGLLNNLTEMVPILRDEGLTCLFFVTAASCDESPGMLWYDELYHLLKAAREGGTDVEVPPLNIEIARGSAANFQAWWWEMMRKASRLDVAARKSWICSLRAKLRAGDPLKHEYRWRLLNVNELKQLADSSMTIGAHSISHPVLSECSDAEAHHEIVGSRLKLERALGTAVWAFAYPFGNSETMADREVVLAREAGFTGAFMNVGGGSVDREDRFRLSRTHVTSEMTLAEIEAHLTGFHSRLQHAVRG